MCPARSVSRRLIERTRRKRLLAESLLDQAALKDRLSRGGDACRQARRRRVPCGAARDGRAAGVCHYRRGADLDPLPQPTPRRSRSARAPAGTGVRAAPVRLPAAPRSTQTSGTSLEAQEDPTALPSGGPLGAQATGAEEGDGNKGATPDGGRAEGALVGRLRPRPVRTRTAVPDLQSDRRCHEGMPVRRG